MNNYQETILSQYANSPTITSLIQYYNEWIDPSADLTNFYNDYWNVDTAFGDGLDVWGKIVNVDRYLEVPSSTLYFGFEEASGQPFGQAPLYLSAQTTVYKLSDSAYRTLILVKALANISSCTANNFNALLQYLFAGRGRCYVIDLGSMQMQFTFEFQLQDFELAIMTKSEALPRPSGVKARVLQVDVANTLGFAEAGMYQTFGHGVFGQQSVAAA